MAFYALANLLDLYDGYSRAFMCGGRSVLVIQDEGRHFAIENRCPHMNAPLASGPVAKGVITCKAHGIGFNLYSGCAEGPLAESLNCLIRYDVVYDGNKLGVNI